MPVVDYESAVAFLLGRVNYETFRRIPYGEMRQNLGRLKAFLELIGRPDARFPVIHVAGTKGKGSTCAMLAAILREAGFRTGCFTSPHLHSLNERFAINGTPCPNDKLVEVVQHLESQFNVQSSKCKVNSTMPNQLANENTLNFDLTFFEYSVLVAFEYFAREQVDIAVIETGLGGRFDATNICEPVLSVITSISFDHTGQLGNTLAAIAREKAGIIKPCVPVVSGVTPHEGDDPREVIRQVAEQNHAALYELHRDFSITLHDNGSFDFHWHTVDSGQCAVVSEQPPETAHGSLPTAHCLLPTVHCPLNLLGRHQRDNAALALASVMLLRQRGLHIPDEAVRVALAQLVVPCRVERLTLPSVNAPVIIIDGAHNKASAEVLLEVLQTLMASQPAGRKILLFGSTLGKDVVGMLETLLPFFDELWLSQYTTSPRTVPIGELFELANAMPDCPQPILTFASPGEALAYLYQSTTERDFVCITGSLYFAAQVAAIFRAATVTERSN